MIKVEVGCLPIFVLEEGDTPDMVNEEYAYILAKNGLHIKKENNAYTALTKVDSVQGLGECESQCDLKIPKLPLDLMEEVRSFFRSVYEKHSSEAAIILYMNTECSSWGFLVPRQEVSAGSVHYDIGDDDPFWNGAWSTGVPEGWIQFGSIHSHAAMGAFHSGVDDKDEFDFEGVHITIGNFNSKLTYACRVVISGEAIKMNLEDACEMTDATEVMPESVMKQVDKMQVKVNKQGTKSNGLREQWPKDDGNRWRDAFSKNEYTNGLYDW